MIEIENLTKRYGSATVVDRVSISIPRGSITVIVGTSGSGKSTLLRMINRLVEPTAGRVSLTALDTTTEPPHLLREDRLRQSRGTVYFRTGTVAAEHRDRAAATRMERRRHPGPRPECSIFFNWPGRLCRENSRISSRADSRQRVGVARPLPPNPQSAHGRALGHSIPSSAPRPRTDLRDIQRRFGTTTCA